MSHSLSEFRRFYDEDARLCILKALAEQNNYTLNDSLLTSIMKHYAIDKGRDYVRTQLRWLADIAGAIQMEERGSVLVSTITQAGLDHVERRSILEGVKRPSPGA